MTLSSDIIDDAAGFLNTDDFAIAATYKALGTGGGVSVNVILNESQGPLIELRESEAESREAILSVPAATVTTPLRTDTYTIASGVHAGIWVAVSSEARDPGIHNVRCRLETTRNTVAQGAHEVRN